MTAPGMAGASAWPRVVVVVVTHHPSLAELALQWAALAPQVFAGVWVDNGPADGMHAIVESCPGQVPHIMAMGRNTGLAAAQNTGVRWAKSQGATHVLLMDQDSLPEPLMVERLLAALSACPTAAAAGPCYVDERNPRSHSPFVQINGIRTRRMPCTEVTSIWPVDHLIASGCLVPVWAFERVGFLREDFFIDFVDVEWSLRARFHGFLLLGVCSAVLRHRLGDRHLRALGRLRHVHSPLRIYFQVRNAFWLYRMPHVARGWKMVSAWRMFLKCAFYLLCVTPRRAYLNNIVRGLTHGLTATSDLHTGDR